MRRTLMLGLFALLAGDCGAQAPALQPMYNVVSQLVYALKGSDVRDVMVNGRPVVRDRVCLTLNQKVVLEKALEFQKAVSKSLRR